MPNSLEIAAADDLLRVALADPAEAVARAQELATVHADPWTLSVVGQARGIVLRDEGHTAAAVRELRSARALARRSGDPDRLADVRATLGTALALDGQTRSGLNELDQAVLGAVGRQVIARCLMRRGHILAVVLGRHREALRDLRNALRTARALGDRLWVARTLVTTALLHLDTGDVVRAERALHEAHGIFEDEGEELLAVQVVHDQGYVAFCRGDLPVALALFDRAAAGYARFGDVPVELGQDRCKALMAAGLPDEACTVAREQLARDAVPPANRAELELSLAFAELARGDTGASSQAARSARDRFRQQGREVATARAQLVVLGSRRRAGFRGTTLAHDATLVAHRLEAARSEDAPVAWLLAGRATVDTGRDATPLWDAAGRYRRHPSGLVRATAWLARALDQQQRGSDRGVWHACRQGLDALDDYRTTLGSTELRALASVQGDELARLALSRAADSRPRAQLWWCERWRASALAAPGTPLPKDRELAGLFAALRANDRKLAEVRDEEEPKEKLERERARLEKAIQHRRRLVGASNGEVQVRAGVDVARLVDEVGDAAFVELFEVDGTLRAVTVTRGKVRAFVVGSAAEATAAVDSARFVLRQAARGRPVRLADAGTRLQGALLGPVVRLLASGPVVVSPSAALHAVPWGLLPALAELPVSVVPTAASWLRARASRARRSGRVLVVGPGLVSGGAEVPIVAAEHPGAVVLRDGAATVDACLRAMDGAALVHVAAHGRFRADNPMFSALELDDGPLTVHDFERLRRAPRRFVLSACDSGVLVPVGANELLGLATALMSMGTAGVLSSVAPVNDEATAELMVHVHSGLDDVDDLGVVMQRVRERSAGDVVSQATAAAFVALGV
ncbi:MAG TPA: CHAT domain-containing protein [Nocardioides sp.]|uniref:CHAT domain-containing protein n=1 Tax=Nocardioides sp. TaxID=35761 RepID=UPI002E2ED2AF|nr:CHAT domain-containing protein [Nocardioides sp.]HEX5087668.1 CHAT domain-containing protein [Nocardioides sp.]